MTKDINEVLLRCWKEAIRGLPSAESRHGGQDAIWFACNRVREMGVPLELAIDLMAELYNPRCKPVWSEYDLSRTVRRAYQEAVLTGQPTRRWPELNAALRDSVVEQAKLTMDDFSKWRPSPCAAPDPYFFLRRLFPSPSHLLCLGAKPYQFRTEPQEWWKDNLEGVQLIVPSVMSSRYGRTREGHLSQRSDSNTGPRQFQVIEFDLAEYGKDLLPSDDYSFIRRLAKQGVSVDDINASLIAHLATKAPLVLAVHSGGRSLHGWFRVKDVPESAAESFFAYACQLGADRKLWTPSQMVRLPDGVRENGRIQQVKYFNPEQI